MSLSCWMVRGPNHQVRAREDRRVGFGWRVLDWAWVPEEPLRGSGLETRWILGSGITPATRGAIAGLVGTLDREPQGRNAPWNCPDPSHHVNVRGSGRIKLALARPDPPGVSCDSGTRGRRSAGPG